MLLHNIVQNMSLYIIIYVGVCIELQEEEIKDNLSKYGSMKGSVHSLQSSKHGQHNWDDEYARSYTKDAISEELLRADSTNNATGDAGECKN